MGSWMQLFAGASLGLTLLACGDATGVSPDLNTTGPALAALSDGPRLIVVKPGAPPLATTHASFWAVQGRRSGVEIEYRASAEGEAAQPFLEFTVPARAQLVDPTGRRLERGDSILITVHVIPGQLAARFSPDGLRFTGRQQARLALSYLYGDGPVNAVRQLAIWYQPCDGSAWEKQRSHIDRRQDMVVADIAHFSNYAVAY